MSKGPCRHKETRWWNEEVAEAVREKKITYRKWKSKNSKEAWMGKKKSRQSVKRDNSPAKEKNRRDVQVI